MRRLNCHVCFDCLMLPLRCVCVTTRNLPASSQSAPSAPFAIYPLTWRYLPRASRHLGSMADRGRRPFATTARDRLARWTRIDERRLPVLYIQHSMVNVVCAVNTTLVGVQIKRTPATPQADSASPGRCVISVVSGTYSAPLPVQREHVRTAPSDCPPTH
jgi:hypothetical protein